MHINTSKGKKEEMKKRETFLLALDVDDEESRSFKVKLKILFKPILF